MSEERIKNQSGFSIPNQEDHAFYAWVNWSSDTGCSPLVGVSMEPRALPVGLHIAKGSLAELRTQVQIAHEIGYLEMESYTTLENECNGLGKMIGRLIEVRKTPFR